MLEIRWHGRGGQGLKTAAEALAQTAFLEGNFVTAFPFYGPEREGAAITAFTRIDGAKIRLRCGVYEPDLVVVTDESLLGSKGQEIVKGLKEDGTLIVNTTASPAQIRAKIGFQGKIVTIPATKIAQDLGIKYAYVPILGAVAKILGLSLPSARKGLNKKLLELKLAPKARERNLKGLKRGYKIKPQRSIKRRWMRWARRG